MIGGLHFDTEAAVSAALAGTSGSPLYDVLPEHVMAAVALLLLPALVWVAATLRPTRLRAVLDGYPGLPPVHRLAAWLLLADAAVHLGLALGHGGPGLRLAFAFAALWTLHVVHRLVTRRPWRLRAAVVLGASLAAYALAVFGGEPPDQVGLAAKLAEVAALAIVLRPERRGRWRAAAASSATVSLIIAVSFVGWVGAFAAAGGAEHAHDHGSGVAPMPGSRLPHSPTGEPTAAEAAAAEELRAATTAEIARYRDPALAAADGYRVDGIHGLDFHAANPAYEADGRVLDPARPETLVYAAGPDGPILLGAMFVMPRIGEPGPTVGGPLTIWHAHEHVCISIVPPGLAGLLSPLGGCPMGSVNLALTPQMIHVWTVPGAPQTFGDLDDEWRRAYVDGAG